MEIRHSENKATKQRQDMAVLAAVRSTVEEATLAITRKQLQELFDNTRAKTSWDIDGNMIWGYFFFGPNGHDLKTLGDELANLGYRFVVVREVEYDEPPEEPEWLLHVERVETHTVDTLLARNTQLEDLASRYQDIIYDGMDVGPVE